MAKQMRSDVRHNLNRLLSAAGELAQEDPAALSIPAVAERASLAASTAWRYFPSVEDLMQAYLHQQIDSFRTAVERAAEQSADPFDATLSAWVDMVLRNGTALVQIRSRRGYLERLYGNDETIVAVQNIWSPGITALLDSLHLRPSLTPIALFLTNTLTDPREILDLKNNAHLGHTETVRRLRGAVIGALHGWCNTEIPSLVQITSDETHAF